MLSCFGAKRPKGLVIWQRRSSGLEPDFAADVLLICVDVQ